MSRGAWGEDSRTVEPTDSWTVLPDLRLFVLLLTLVLPLLNGNNTTRSPASNGVPQAGQWLTAALVGEFAFSLTYWAAN